MKRTKRKDATELSVFIKKKDNGQYEIVDPSMEGEGLPARFFLAIMKSLADAQDSYNTKQS